MNSKPTPEEVKTWTRGEVNHWCNANNARLEYAVDLELFCIRNAKFSTLWMETPALALSEWLRVIAAPEREQALREENDKLRATYRCFHCDFETTDRLEAAAHFGERDDPSDVTPLCRAWLSMSESSRIAEFQSLQRQLIEYQDEEGKKIQEIEALDERLGSIECEMAHRFSGKKTIHEIWCLFDSLEGRTIAAEEENARLRTALEKAKEALALAVSLANKVEVADDEDKFINALVTITEAEKGE